MSPMSRSVGPSDSVMVSPSPSPFYSSVCVCVSASTVAVTVAVASLAAAASTVDDTGMITDMFRVVMCGVVWCGNIQMQHNTLWCGYGVDVIWT
mmetsp:Transcript_21974/g.25431  ORF Transcript_21974/g.25431 Transcript_21974/m.25431 type:complete len:94 (+) Transcript_21974:79-360(+)